jgi:hypothetical protein
MTCDFQCSREFRHVLTRTLRDLMGIDPVQGQSEATEAKRAWKQAQTNCLASLIASIQNTWSVQ